MKLSKSFTLVELILGIALIGTVILVVSTVFLSFNKRFITVTSEAKLYHDTSFAMEHILRQIKESEYVDVIGPTDIKLKYPDNREAEYYLDGTSKELRFRKDTTKPNEYELLLRDVISVTFTGVESQGLNRYRGCRVNIQAKDPTNKTNKISFLQSLAFCRIYQGGGLVRVVDVTRTIERGIYNTIQEAVDIAQDTDIIQVSSNNKTPYRENVYLTNKSLVLEGAYDNTDWQRHFLPTVQVDPAYETIVSGTASGTGNGVISIGGSLTAATIDGFTITNSTSNAEGISIKGTDPINCTITNNKIKLLLTAIRVADTSGAITISNNSMEESGLFGVDCTYPGSKNSWTIESNKINNKTHTAVFIDQRQSAVHHGHAVQCPVTLSGNIISDNHNGIIIENYGNVNLTNNQILNCETRSIWFTESTGNFVFTNNVIKQQQLQTDAGIEFSQTGGTVTLKNNAVLGNKVGLDISSVSSGNPITSVTLIDNLISDNLYGGFIAVDIHNMNFTLTNNIIRRSTSSYGVNVSFLERNFSITNNTIENNNIGLSASIPHVTPRSRDISNNVIINNNSKGINLLSFSSLPGASKINFRNNLIAYNGIGLEIPAGNVIEALFDNNIVAFNGGTHEIKAGSSLLGIRNCIIWHPGGGSAVSVSDAISYSDGVSGSHCINQDPKFISATDYHLQVSSPCKNTGDPSILDTDGTTSDMGVYGGPGAGVVGASPSLSSTGYIGSKLVGLVNGVDYIE